MNPHTKHVVNGQTFLAKTKSNILVIITGYAK